VLLHVLGHIDTDHRVFISEHDIRKRLGKLGLADAGRSEEDKRSDRTARILESHSAAAYRACNRFNSVVLPDYPLLENFVEVEKSLLLLGCELLHGDTRPCGHDIGDIVGSHHKLVCVL